MRQCGLMAAWDSEIDAEEAIYERYLREEREREQEALTPEGIASSNRSLLDQYRDLRSAADVVVDAWRGHRDVTEIWLVGSLARAPWKEVPRFQPYRRERIQLWHECQIIDLAVRVCRTEDLGRLRKLMAKAVAGFRGKRTGVASGQVHAFLLQHAANRYLGRLCDFNRCPKPRKIECLVPRCGSSPFLRRIAGFQWRWGTLAPDRSVKLFDRSGGLVRRAADLPLPRQVGAER